jgi:hypothetical protein
LAKIKKDKKIIKGIIGQIPIGFAEFEDFVGSFVGATVTYSSANWDDVIFVS